MYIESEENVDREPRIHVIADLSNEKFSLHLSQCSVELYDTRGTDDGQPSLRMRAEG